MAEQDTTQPEMENGPGPDYVPPTLVPEHMLNIRIVPIPEQLGTKENPDPNKVIVVGYDTFMQVVNGLAGSGAGANRRIAQLLQESVRAEAIGQFAAVIAQASADGSAAGYEAGKAAALDEVAGVADEAARAVAAAQGEAEEAKAAVQTMSEELELAQERIVALEKELAEERKPAASRAKKPEKADEADSSEKADEQE